jgi:hypothetical protein
LDSAGYSEKYHKDKCKNKNATLRQKILKITRILVHNQNFEKQKVEFQNTRTALTSFRIHEICQQKWSWCRMAE